MNPYILLILAMLVGGIALTSTNLPIDDAQKNTTTTISANITEMENQTPGNQTKTTEKEECDNFLMKINNQIAKKLGTTLCQLEKGFKESLKSHGYDPYHISFYIMLILIIAVFLDQIILRGSGGFGNILIYLIIFGLILLMMGVI